MSEWKLRDIEFNLIPEMKRNIRNLEERNDALSVTIGELTARLYQLEEKERERARDEHAREEHLDFLDSEGLGKQ